MFNQARHSIRFVKRDQRGQVLAMAAVSMVAVIAVGALAVDLGMAFAARAAAQRAADSAALAGASAFIDYTYTQPGVSGEAEERALKYALNNDVLARPIEPSQVTITVIPSEQKVRVRIEAANLPTWFARIMGVFSMDVAAVAAAVASDAGRTDECVLPFAIGDLWHDEDDDKNFNLIPDENELWNFDPSKGDKYAVYHPDEEDGCKGYGLGSCYRDGQPEGEGQFIKNDVGRRIWIKAGPPNPKRDPEAGGLDIMVGPGNFYIWEMPDPEMECQGRPGADWVSENIKGCNGCPVILGDEYETQTGNIASIKDAIEDVINEDPDAVWNPTKERVESPKTGIDNSPRIRVVPLWSPYQELQGKTTVVFNNFARIFIEGGGQPKGGGDFAIYARFLGTVMGDDEGPTTGSLVKYLRLVE